MTPRPIRLAAAAVAVALVAALHVSGCADPAEDGDADTSSSTGGYDSTASYDDDDEDDDLLADLFSFLIFGDDGEDDAPGPPPPPPPPAPPPIVATVVVENATAERVRITFDGRLAADRPAIVTLAPGARFPLGINSRQVGYTLFALGDGGRIVDVHVTDEGPWLVLGAP